MRLIILSIFILLTSINSSRAREQLRFENLSADNRISNRVVHTILQDDNGFVWIGTANGLNRYDGYEFKIYNKSTLTNSWINHILQTSTGKLLVATNSGLNLYDDKNDKFTEVVVGNDKFNDLKKLRIRTLFECRSNNIYLGTNRGLIILDADLRIKKQILFVEAGDNFQLNIVRAITQDKSGVIWVGTYNGLYRYNIDDDLLKSVDIGEQLSSDPTNNLVLSLQKISENDSLLVVGTETGVVLLNTVTNEKRAFKKELNFELSNNVIKSMAQFSENRVMLGTDGGLNILNIKSGNVEQYNHNSNNKHSIANDIVSVIYRDKSGVLWLGTNNGVSQLNIKHKQFKTKDIRLSNKDGRFIDVVINNIVRDWHDNLWLSSANGLFKIDQKEDKQTLYDISDGLKHNNTQKLYIDKDNILWVCTSNGLNYLKNDKFNFITPSDSTALKYVINVHQTADSTLWVTHMNGVSKIVKTPSGSYDCQLFASTKVRDQNNVEFRISEVDGDRLWIGTNQGLLTLDLKSGEYTNIGDDWSETSFHEKINTIKNIDSRIFIGTDDGLYSYFDENSKLIYHDIFKNKAQMPIFTISSTNSNELWLASQNALIKYNLDDEKAVSYTYSHDLSIDDITPNSMYTSDDSTIFLGSYGKYVSFDPKKIKSYDNHASIAITKFSLNDSESTQFKNISDVKLAWNQTSFAISFALLGQSNPNGNIYQYKLDGYDDEWQYSMGGNNTITYHQLSPGRYKFVVRGANSYGKWSENEAKVDIFIQRRWWLYILSYSLVAIAILLIFIFTRAKVKLNNQLQVEKMERKKIKELNDIRMKFFTNISHEFRTPITLILGPIDNIAHHINDKTLKPQIDILRQNTNKLLKLIDQIMNLCKLESDQISLKSQVGDIVRFAENIFAQFSEYANKRDTKLEFTSELSEVTMMFDQDKMEQIIYNLLYNAIKFTPEGGKITMRIKESEQDGFVDIDIEDTGVGIKEGDLGRVFECFYQGETPETIVEQGTGIGLMLVHKFVTMHSGVVSVKSEVGVGSQFKVSLPIMSMSSPKTSFDYSIADKSRLTLLIAEDNHQMREYIKLNLAPDYNIIEASDGEQAWELIKKYRPNLIISDVTMPKMDGITLCTKVRGEFSTNNIPIILLTAKSAEVDTARGIKAGANSYMVKPFSSYLLKLKISSLLNEYKKVEIKARLEAVQEPRVVAMESRDEKFMRDVMNIIEQNMANSEFDVKIICDKLGYSHQQIYRKIVTLTGRNINSFIRHIRLTRAKQLLKDSDLNLSEVMYKVGFSSRTYFNTQFKKEFEKSPNEYKNSVRNS